MITTTLISLIVAFFILSTTYLLRKKFDEYEEKYKEIGDWCCDLSLSFYALLDHLQLEDGDIDGKRAIRPISDGLKEESIH